MQHDQGKSSRLFAIAGGLLTVSGLLMAVCGRLAYGGIFWAAASCMFFAAYNFRLAENRRKRKMSKKLYKSNDNKMIDGVCGGIAEYFDIDPTMVRLGWVLFCALGGSGFLAYIIAAIIIPRKPC